MPYAREFAHRVAWWQVIEAKEKELLDCIAQNYSRIKGVERELAGLQLQLRLTSGPKKSALELLRRKIELQNEKVVLARGKYQASRKVIASFTQHSQFLIILFSPDLPCPAKPAPEPTDGGFAGHGGGRGGAEG